MLKALSQIQPTCHNNANGIKPGSNLKMTDTHAAKNSQTACLRIN